MPRVLSLSTRSAINAESTDNVPIMLVRITHEDLAEPVLLSSDPTQRLSLEPELRYGTIHRGEEYEFVLMQAILPDDSEGTPVKTSLSFDNVARDMASAVRAVSTPALVDLTVVFSQTPNLIEEQYIGLLASRAPYDANRVGLDISRESLTTEPWPSERMTQDRFPGQFA